MVVARDGEHGDEREREQHGEGHREHRDGVCRARPAPQVPAGLPAFGSRIRPCPQGGDASRLARDPVLHVPPFGRRPGRPGHGRLRPHTPNGMQTV